MIHVIGCGWYACHIISESLEGKREYICWERGSRIFSGASFKNQNRLHLGFHYPRNALTRKQSREGFERFLSQYPRLTADVKHNLYVVSIDSVIDFESYTGIFLHEQYEFSRKENIFTSEKIEGIIDTNERLILHESSRRYWENRNLNIAFNEEVAIRNGVLLSKKGVPISTSQDIIIDCSYGELKLTEDFYRQYFISFIIAIDAPPFGAFTVMDGPFFSIYPYETERGDILYTLTHVKHCVIQHPNISRYDINQIFERSLADCTDYLSKEITETIKPIDFFISTKTKPYSQSDSRAQSVSRNGRVIAVNSGKIDAVFGAQERVERLIREIEKEK